MTMHSRFESSLQTWLLSHINLFNNDYELVLKSHESDMLLMSSEDSVLQGSHWTRICHTHNTRFLHIRQWSITNDLWWHQNYEAKLMQWLNVELLSDKKYKQSIRNKKTKKEKEIFLKRSLRRQGHNMWVVCCQNDTVFHLLLPLLKSAKR